VIIEPFCPPFPPLSPPLCGGAELGSRQMSQAYGKGWSEDLERRIVGGDWKRFRV
jgi:hypothetical protein